MLNRDIEQKIYTLLLQQGWNITDIHKRNSGKGNGLLNKPIEKYRIIHDKQEEYVAVKISENEPKELFRQLYQKYGQATPYQLELFDTYCSFLSMDKMSERELTFYQNYNKHISLFLPRIYAMSRNEQLQILIMEDLSECDCMDQVNSPHKWKLEDVDLVIQSLSLFHHIDICPQPTKVSRQKKEQWGRIAEFLEVFNKSMESYIEHVHIPVALNVKDYIDNLEKYEKIMNQYRQVMIHNDFNIRNVCIDRTRNQLKIYDWEFVDYKNPIIDIVDFLLSLSSEYLSLERLDRWLMIYLEKSYQYGEKNLSFLFLKEQLYYNTIKFAATRMNMYWLFYARKKVSYIERMYNNLLLLITYCCKR